MANDPSAALARELELEELVAEFSVGLRELRSAEPALDLIFTWKA